MNKYKNLDDRDEAFAYFTEILNEIFSEIFDEVDDYIEAVYPNYTLHQKKVAELLLIKQTYVSLLHKIDKEVELIEERLQKTGFFEETK